MGRFFLAFFEVLRQDKKGVGFSLRFFYESEPVLKDYESDLFFNMKVCLF